MPGSSAWLGNKFPPDVVTENNAIRDQLIALRVLESPSDESKSNETGRFGKTSPQTLQVITAGASQLSKWWIGLVGAGFGASALLQGVVGLGWEPFGLVNAPEPMQQAVLTISAAFVAAALVIAIAIMVRGDVASRALASAAEYQARAIITQALVGAFQYEPSPGPPAHARYLVTVAPGQTHVARAFGVDTAGVLYVELEDGTRVTSQDIRGLQPIPEGP